MLFLFCGQPAADGIPLSLLDSIICSDGFWARSYDWLPVQPPVSTGRGETDIRRAAGWGVPLVTAAVNNRCYRSSSPSDICYFSWREWFSYVVIAIVCYTSGLGG
jgi:hypothetical protein